MRLHARRRLRWETGAREAAAAPAIIEVGQFDPPLPGSADFGESGLGSAEYAPPSPGQVRT